MYFDLNVMLNIMVLMLFVLVFQLSMFIRMIDLLYNSGAQPFPQEWMIDVKKRNYKRKRK